MRYGKNLRTAGVIVLALPAAIFAFIRLWPVIRLCAAALLFAFLIRPLKARFDRFMPKSASTAACFLTVCAVIMGLVSVILIPALSEMKRLPEYLENGVGSLRGVLSSFDLNADLAGKAAGFIRPDAQSLYKTIVTGAGSVASFFVNLAAVLALSWFLLSDWEQISLRMILFVPSACRAKTINALSAVRRELGGYLRAQTVIIALVSALAIAALFLIGTPIPLAMGLMYGLLNAIPYFGPLIGLLPPVLSALSVSLKSALFTMGALLLIQQIDNYVLSPHVMGEVSGSGPASVLIAVAAGSALGGVMGMFLALPVLISAKAVYRAFTAPSY